MALLFMDGMDFNDQGNRYGIAASYAMQTQATGAPGNNGRIYRSTWSQEQLYASYPLSQTIFMGMYIYINSGAAIMTFRGDSGATTHLTVSITPNGAWSLSGVSTYASGTNLVGPGQWMHLQLKLKVADSGGSVEMRINGQSTAYASFTGDTKNGGTELGTTRMYFYGSSDTFFSDLYICDDTGSYNNSFLGECVINTILPNADGNYSQLLGSDGNSTNNYLLVDEGPPSGTDYVGSATVGQKDSYGLANLPSSVTGVKAIQGVSYMIKSDAGAASMKQLIRTGGTDYTSSALALSLSNQILLGIRDVNPGTSVPWTISDVNALEIGAEVA